MPYKTEHSCRLRDPSTVRITGRKAGSGKNPDRLLGKTRAGTTVVQSLRFPVARFTEAEARAACGSSGGTFEAADPTANYLDAQLVVPGGGGCGGGPCTPPGEPPAEGPPASSDGVGHQPGTIGIYTSPDILDGHTHRIWSEAWDRERKVGVTECFGGGNSSIPVHAHAILNNQVVTYKRGAYTSDHGSVPLEEVVLDEAAEPDSNG